MSQLWQVGSNELMINVTVASPSAETVTAVAANPNLHWFATELNVSVEATSNLYHSFCVSPNACPGGYFGRAIRGASMAACVMCPKGAFCEAGAMSPTLCSNGTYQDEVRQTACKECSAREGHYCHYEGKSQRDRISSVH